MKNERLINGISIKTRVRDITCCNSIRVEAGTNGYQGGDSGHGSRTYIRLKDLGGSDITFNISQDRKELEMLIGGDSELETITEGLMFIVDRLLKITCKTQDNQ